MKGWGYQYQPRDRYPCTPHGLLCGGPRQTFWLGTTAPMKAFTKEDPVSINQSRPQWPALQRTTAFTESHHCHRAPGEGDAAMPSTRKICCCTAPGLGLPRAHKYSWTPEPLLSAYASDSSSAAAWAPDPGSMGGSTSAYAPGPRSAAEPPLPAL